MEVPVDVSHLRYYNTAFSDAESGWPADMKAEMRRKGQAVVMGHLGLWQRLRFGWLFMREHARMKGVDIGHIRARGMNNEAFLKQQIEYIALFSAVAQIKGTDKAIAILCEVMDVTAREALLLCLPELKDMKAFDDPLQAWRAYAAPIPEASTKAGCQELRVFDDGPDAVQMDVHWCVWLELARALGVPEACIPNCYSDDLVFPEYFEALGLRYSRTQTLARGGTCCNFRFERPQPT